MRSLFAASSQPTLPDASSTRNGSASGLLSRTSPAPIVKRPVKLWIVLSEARRAPNLKAIGPSADKGGGFLSKVSRSARLTSCASTASVGVSPALACASIVHGPEGPTAEIRALASSPE